MPATRKVAGAPRPAPPPLAWSARVNIDPQIVRQIIVTARRYDVKVPPVEPDPGSNMAEDEMLEVIEDHPDDPVEEELRGLIEQLNEDEQVRLVALAWIGRGSYDKEEWQEALREAKDQHSDRTAEYLMGLPLLGDYLAEGMAEIGYQLVEDE